MVNMEGCDMPRVTHLTLNSYFEIPGLAQGGWAITVPNYFHWEMM